MSLSSTCISWQSLPHTSPRLYVTGDMQSHENQMPHNKRKAITLEDCKRLYELTSCCIHCVFYRGNYTSIFLSFTLISNWTRISVYYHNSWIIGKNACWLSMYKRKKKKSLSLFKFICKAESHLVRFTEKYLVSSNSFQHVGIFLPSLQRLQWEQLGSAMWLWLDNMHSLINHNAQLLWCKKEKTVKLSSPL